MGGKNLHRISAKVEQCLGSFVGKRIDLEIYRNEDERTVMFGVDDRDLAVYEADVQLEIGSGTLQGMVGSCYGSASNYGPRPIVFCEVQELLYKRCKPT